MTFVDLNLTFRGDPVVIMEKEETHGFWEAIGGEETYYEGIRREVSIDIRNTEEAV